MSCTPYMSPWMAAMVGCISPLWPEMTAPEGEQTLELEAKAGREGERDGFHWTPETAWAWSFAESSGDQIKLAHRE